MNDRNAVTERIEKLVGKGPRFLLSDDCEYVQRIWQSWRNQLIDRLAKDAEVSYESRNDVEGTTLALDFQPIRKGVTKAEIVEKLREVHKAFQKNHAIDWGECTELADRIEKEGLRDE